MIANLEQILTGKTREHLVPLPNPLSDKHFLQAEAVDAFLTLQQAAKAAGFNLQPASTYRDFDRQMLIWNAKFNGERKVHDDNGCAIDMAKLDDLQKIQAMMRWSAVPGSSRHHWGTEIDIFDPDLLPEGQHLQLEPWEYQTGSYFAPLAEWLHHNAERFGFYFPFDGIHNAKVGYEPWHISYRPISAEYEKQFNYQILQKSWQNEPLAGKACLLEHFNRLFS
ncbi:D-alanyl-D-alanine carboxypeptidase [Actinobacillus pleuropneumoniae]|uniref:M15 family metallopeptidase n=1 Tax=Actinobacillus pleuropneumoniae TaxID=715 RepID=UPI0001E49F29|nr:M15 family metallopeptidase [Actinobacillus pleuropneumoniae]EFM88945.1 Peptidase M15B and M15C DD-carboxypeptidase VanY/endolysin [Actinobacillus pleuropneumoniae serovar 4 str. M62]QXP21888.1 M15 family metallopeptidase [Actinobacillus pleuropneumoniae serovar 8 str. 405]UKH19403.1 D-alanyl-D-alanine carboxypeptidase family protein [Actinobacillus pleuropneumoniae]UKH37916.1 D-alanyl-D-alanine carboxypeptidase family protein [Actinobacillus pleuropneumoniae serovar 8 str. 405]UKH42134.1 D